ALIRFALGCATEDSVQSDFAAACFLIPQMCTDLWRPRVTAYEFALQLNARRTGAGRWQAKCPAHPDHNPSLSIAEGRDGRTLVRCWAGCAPDAVLAAL